MRENPFSRGKGASGNEENNSLREHYITLLYKYLLCFKSRIWLSMFIINTKYIGDITKITGKDNCPPPRDKVDSPYSIMHFSIHCKEHAFTFRIVSASWSHPGLFLRIKQVRTSIFSLYIRIQTQPEHPVCSEWAVGGGDSPILMYK